MTISFPALKPTTRTFTAADYPVTSPEYARGIAYPRLRGQRPNGALLELTFKNITDAEAASILNAYALSRSGFHPLSMPPEIVSGIDLQALRNRIRLNTYLRWHFNDPPKVDAGLPGISTVSVTLIATISRDTRKLSELATNSGAFTLNGQAANFSFTAIVRLTANSGAFTLNGQAANFDFTASVLIANSGVFALSGQNVSITLSGDPDFASVSLLLPMDGTNGSTTFTEEGPLDIVPTAQGASILTTASSISGGSAGNFLGTSPLKYLTFAGAGVANCCNFGTGDFTIEMNVWPENVATIRALFTAGNYEGVGNGFHCWLQGSLVVFTDVGGNFHGAGSVGTPNIRYHIAYVRSSGVLTIYVNGISTYSVANTRSYTPTADSKILGGGVMSLSGMFYHNNAQCIIDDFRITKAARYTVNFTPPTTPFWYPPP